MPRNLMIANRIREVLLDGKWIANTNFKEQLLQIGWQQAIQKVDSLNTIALLTFHVNYYLAGLLNAFDSGRLEISDKYSFDLPAIQTAADWDHLVSNFLANAERFATHIEQMEDGKLDEPFIEEKYGTCLRNIEAVIEHSYYHLGQVVLLGKIIKPK